MKLKMGANGTFEAKEVNGEWLPVWVMPDGSEVAHDTPTALKKMGELNSEARTRRLAFEELEAKFKSFEGLDPEAAKKALQFAQSMEGKKAMDDDAIKQLIASAVKPLQDQLAESQKTLGEKDGQIYKLTVGNQFATSKFLSDKTLLTPDAAEALFGKHFKVENGKPVPTDAAGNPIYSKDPNKYGEPADFDEALAVLYEAYPYKENYRKGSGASGAGTPAGGKAGNFAVRSRSDFKTDAEKSQFISEHGLQAFKDLPATAS